MKKLFNLFLLSIGFTSAFAQVNMIEYKSGSLTKEEVRNLVEKARKSGTQEWELKLLEKGLLNKGKTNKAANRTNPNTVFSTGCNIDFEQGNYNSWTLTSGYTNLVNLPCNTCAASPGGIAAITSYTNSGSTWTNGIDLCSGQPVVSPTGGSHALCLNDKSAGGKIESLTQTFLVDSSNSVFSFQYMAVLQDGGHPAFEQPYFVCQVLDTGNAVVPCSYYIASAASNISGWQPCTACGSGVNYKPWTTVVVDLRSYIGKNVTLQYIVSDCNQGGHWGYVYLDAFCGRAPVSSLTNTLCQGSTLTLNAPAGYTTYSWAGPGILGNTNQQAAQVNLPGTYSVTLSASCNGNILDTLLYTVSSSTATPPGITVSGNTTFCSAQTTTLTANGATSYTWSPNAGVLVAPSVVVTPSVSTTYTVNAIDSITGCLSSAIVPVIIDQCVWPGDADESLQTDNYDLLPIGLAYGKTGPSRAVQGNTWQADFCYDWSDTLSNGKNIKYSDCNGDGTVDMNDTLAVNLNYSLTHPARLNAGSVLGNLPDVLITFNKNFYYPGDVLIADINLGFNGHSLTNFYGAAFTLQYDNTQVKPGTENFYFNNSWVGTINADAIKLGKLFAANGKVEASLTRINHSNTSGYGKVATLELTLRDTLTVNQLFFSFSNGIKTDSAGNYDTLYPSVDSVLVQQGVGVAQYNRQGAYAIYPNPVKSVLYVDGKPGDHGVIRIMNLLGAEVYSGEIDTVQASIDLSSLPAGIYIIQLGTCRQRFVKE